jgi:hypothetical protein
MSTIIQKLREVAWQPIVTRPSSALYTSLTVLAENNFKKATGISWTGRPVLWFSSGELLYGQAAINKLEKYFIAGKPATFHQFLTKLISRLTKLNNVTEAIESINTASLTKTKLKKLITLYTDQALLAHNFLMPMPIAGKIISQKILALLPSALLGVREQWLHDLIYPVQDNTHVKEERGKLA